MLLDPLTRRELDILRLIAGGMSNQEIAEQLVLSAGTVKWYVKQLFSKLDVHTRTQAMERGQEILNTIADRKAGVLAETQEAGWKHLTNLPAETTAFIGRERELAAVLELMRRPDVRLVSLTGPGGTGKTRLCLRVAAELLNEYEHGVYWVELASVGDPDLVLPTIADMLRIKESQGTPLTDSVKLALKDQQLLLVLDNFEQVSDAAPVIGSLLTAAPELKVITTSRETLRIYGEYDYPVPPLGLPDTTKKLTGAMASSYEAVSLFIQRAKASDPAFEISEENAQAIAEICVKLDGLPLAIELAAARSRMLTPEAMLDRLSDQLTMLTGGARDLPLRQQTIRNTIDWSYNLLDEAEKALFARLGIFAGGWTLEAAEAVSGGSDIFAGMESLLDKNLIRTSEPSEGEARFDMLETVREYAYEQLASGTEADAIHQRHADAYVRLSARFEQEIKGEHGLLWFARTDLDFGNLRVAITWALRHARPDIPIRMAQSLTDYILARPQLREWLAWLELAVAMPGLASAQRGVGLIVSGMLNLLLGDYVEARMNLTEGMQLAQGSPYVLHVVIGLALLSIILSSDGEQDEALAALEEGLALARASDDTAALMWSLNGMGEYWRLNEDYERAVTFYNEGLELIIRERKAYAYEKMLLGNRATALLHQGKFEEAREALAKSARNAFEQNDTRLLAADLAGLAATKKDFEVASRLVGASVALTERLHLVLEPADQANIDLVTAHIRVGIGQQEFDNLFAQGKLLSTEDALALALRDDN